MPLAPFSQVADRAGIGANQGCLAKLLPLTGAEASDESHAQKRGIEISICACESLGAKLSGDHRPTECFSPSGAKLLRIFSYPQMLGIEIKLLRPRNEPGDRRLQIWLYESRICLGEENPAPARGSFADRDSRFRCLSTTVGVRNEA